MACLGSSVQNDQPTDFELEDDDDWDSWARRKRSVPNYRDPSGKCMWGILRDLNNTEHETVRIRTGKTDFKSKGTILDIDGKKSFGAWAADSGCDRIDGSLEASSLPGGLGDRFSMMLPVMCRTLDMVAVKDYSLEGIPVTRYEAEHDSLEQDPCYCPDNSTNLCLPSGYLNLGPCYPDISPPLAVSFPHGLHSASNPLLTHQPRPDYEKHNLHIDLNTELGVPLVVQVNFQLSAILRPDPAFPLLDQITNTRLVPLFWASEGFSQPTGWMISQTKLALSLPTALSLGAAATLTTIGLLLLLLWVWRHHRRHQAS